MTMKEDAVWTLVIVLAGVLAVWAIIKGGRAWLDITLGDDPLGAVGGDDPYDPDNLPGWYTRYFLWKSGNPLYQWYDNPVSGSAGSTYLATNPFFWVVGSNVWLWNQTVGKWIE